MPVNTNAFRAAAALAAALLSGTAHAEGIDTEHIFGFMIGSDVGNAGEREFQSQTTGRLDKDSRHYRAGEQELELELVPKNSASNSALHSSATTLAVRPASTIAVSSPGRAPRSICADASSIARLRRSA